MTKSAMLEQLRAAIDACEGRIENGAIPASAFEWLREEMELIANGEEIYE